jgi:hypothetical protein
MLKILEIDWKTYTNGLILTLMTRSISHNILEYLSEVRELNDSERVEQIMGYTKFLC